MFKCSRVAVNNVLVGLFDSYDHLTMANIAEDEMALEKPIGARFGQDVA